MCTDPRRTGGQISLNRSLNESITLSSSIQRIILNRPATQNVSLSHTRCNMHPHKLNISLAQTVKSIIVQLNESNKGIYLKSILSGEVFCFSMFYSCKDLATKGKKIKKEKMQTSGELALVLVPLTHLLRSFFYKNSCKNPLSRLPQWN